MGNSRSHHRCHRLPEKRRSAGPAGERPLAVADQQASDLSVGDDAGTVRQDHAAQNRSRRQKIMLNLIRLETTDKTQRGLRMQRKKAARDEDIRKTLLGLTPRRPPGGEIRQGA